MKTEIHKSMARAFFASAWADQCEECGNSSILSGNEIMTIMPDEVDPAAVHAADTLCMDMERVNGASVERIYEWAKFVHGRSDDKGDRPLTPELFGHYCAMQAMGHGVGLESFGSNVLDSVQVPYCEFGSHSLDKDYFTPKED